MKKILLLLFSVLVFSGISFAAVVGNGTCTGPSEAVTGQNMTVAFTFTVATNNMVAGNIKIKWPSAMVPPVAGNIVLTGSATEAKKASVFTHDGISYIGVTATANVAQTIIVTVNNLTMTAVPGATSFVVSSADASKSFDFDAAISSSPSIYVWNGYNAIAVMTCEPTPALLTTNTDDLRYQFAWTVSPVAGGRIYWAMALGTPGYNSTPNPTSWVANGTDKDNAARILATPGNYSTPVCSSAGCYADVQAAATIVIGEKVEIWVGKPTGVPTQGVVGTNYAKNLGLDIYVSAGNAATPSTPVVMPTRAAGVQAGRFLVTNATPTQVATITANENGGLNLYGTGVYGSLKTFKFGSSGQYSLPQNATSGTISITRPIYGSYAISYITRFQDVNNDGEYRTNTTTATYYSLPVLTNKAQAFADGMLTRESIYQATAKAATPLYTTKYAQATYIAYFDMWGNSGCSVAISNGTTGTLFANIAVPNTMQAVNPTINPIIPAETLCQITKTAGIDNSINGVFYSVPLPAR